MKKPLGICALLALALFFIGSLSAQTDPFLGTCKLNVKKSKFVAWAAEEE